MLWEVKEAAVSRRERHHLPKNGENKPKKSNDKKCGCGRIGCGKKERAISSAVFRENKKNMSVL